MRLMCRSVSAQLAARLAHDTTAAGTDVKSWKLPFFMAPVDLFKYFYRKKTLQMKIVPRAQNAFVLCKKLFLLLARRQENSRVQIKMDFIKFNSI